MPFFVIEDRMKSFLNQFGTRIYLKPEPSYKSLEGRAQDAENAIYLESGKSYEPYASHIVDCNNLYHTGKPKEKAVKSVIKSLNLSQIPPVFGE